MAKNKAVSSGPNRKSRRTDEVQSTHLNPNAKSLNADSPVRHRVLSTDQIGHVAGELWQLLSEDGDQSLTSIKKSIDASDVVVMAAMGWLAREGKLKFAAKGRSVKVSLR